MTQQEFFGGRHFHLPPHKSSPVDRKIGRTRFPLRNRLSREAVAYGCQFPREISGRDVSLIGLFRQAPLDNPTERSRGVAVLPYDRFGRFPQNGYHCLGCGISLKGALSGHDLVKHQAERELVRPEIQPPSAGLLR